MKILISKKKYCVLLLQNDMQKYLRFYCLFKNYIRSWRLFDTEKSEIQL